MIFHENGTKFEGMNHKVRTREERKKEKKNKV